MINTTDLQQRIRLGEDSYLELKQLVWRGVGKINEPHPDSVADEAAAFANTKGGQLVLGVDDKTRSVTGHALDDLDGVEQWLGNALGGRIEPELHYQTQHVELTAADGSLRVVIVVDIPRSLWVHRSPGGYLHRVGHMQAHAQTSLDYRFRGNDGLPS